MIYEYSRNTNKSKVTVSCGTVKSRTHLSSFATMFNPLTLICSLQHAFVSNEVYSSIDSTSLMCNFEHSTQFNCTFIINKYLHWCDTTTVMECT